MARTSRILVVEDQEGVAGLIADALSGAYEAICAPNVAQALEHLMAGGIDLVLLDCVLPGGTMWQVVLESDRLGIPVVLMTGDPAQMNEISGGPRPYILKPFSIATLLDVIDGAIADGASVGPADAPAAPPRDRPRPP